jgi:hypothetical protein
VVAAATVPAHHLVDVILHHLLQGGVVEAAVGHPAGELGVPDKGVAADVLPVLAGPVHVLVGRAEGKLAAVGLGGVPLLGVLGRDRAELSADDVLLLEVVPHGEGGADVLPSGSLHGSIQTLHLAGREGPASFVSLTIIEQ